jgi:hypothetical protein
MQVREGFAAAIWTGVSSIAAVSAMGPLIVWYLQ